MNRRGFLGMLGAAIAGAAYDPDLALWVPGKKKIFIPPAAGWLKAVCPVNIGDMLTFAGDSRRWRVTEVYPPDGREIATIVPEPVDLGFLSDHRSGVSAKLTPALLCERMTSIRRTVVINAQRRG